MQAPLNDPLLSSKSSSGLSKLGVKKYAFAEVFVKLGSARTKERGISRRFRSSNGSMATPGENAEISNMPRSQGALSKSYFGNNAQPRYPHFQSIIFNFLTSIPVMTCRCSQLLLKSAWR